MAHDAGGTGGMETQVAHLALGLAGRGYPVTVFSCTCAFAGEAGVRWVRVPAPRASGLRLPWFALGAAVRVAARRPPVLITTGAILPLRADLAVVHFCHHAYRRRHGPRRAARDHPLWRANARLAEGVSLAAERWCYRPQRCGRLVAVSPSTAADLRQVPGPLAPIAVAESGVDTARFRPRPQARGAARLGLGLPPQAPVALFLGGDWPLKRPGMAVEALVAAPGWYLLVAGPGDADDLRRLAARWGVAERVRVVGPQPDPLPCYAAADVLVHPSASESWSLVLLEAAACGLPVVTTLDNSLARELADQGAALQVGATPRDIAAALLRLRPAQRAAMGRAGRALARTRDWARTVDTFEGLIAAGGVAAAATPARDGMRHV